MRISIMAFPPIFVVIGGPHSALNATPDPEIIPAARMLDPCKLNIIIMIPVAGAVIHRLGNIISCIGDIGIHMTATAIIVRNHFPTVLCAAIGETGTPLIAAYAPLDAADPGKIPLKGFPHLSRCFPMPVLGNGKISRRKDQEG